MLTTQAAAILALLATSTLVSAHGHVASWTINGEEKAGYNPSNPLQLGATAERPTDNSDQGFVSLGASATLMACGGAKTGTGLETWDLDAGSTVTAHWNTWPDSHKGPIQEYMAKCPGTTCDGVDAGTLDWFKISEVNYDVATKTWPTDQVAKPAFGPSRFPRTLPMGTSRVQTELILSAYLIYPTCFQANVVGGGSGVPADTAKFPELYDLSGDFQTINIYNGDLTKFAAPGPALYGGGGGAAPAPAPAPSSSAAPVTPSSSSAAPVVTASSPEPVVTASSAEPVVTASSAAPVVTASSAAPTMPSASSAEPVAPAPSAAPSPPIVTPPTDTPDDEDCPISEESPNGECPEEEEEMPPVVTPPTPETSPVVTPPATETSAVVTPPATETSPVVTPPTTGGSLGGAAPAIIKSGDKFVVDGASYNFEGDAKYASCMSQMNKCKNWANGLPNAEVGAAFTLCDSQAATCFSGSKKREVVNRYSRRAVAAF